MTTSPPEPPDRTPDPPPGQPWDGPQHTYPTYLPGREGRSGRSAVGLVALLFIAPCLIGLLGAVVFAFLGTSRDAEVTTDGVEFERGDDVRRVDKDLLERGDCVRDPLLADATQGDELAGMPHSVEVVDCHRRHHFEVVTSFGLDPERHRTQQEITDRAERRCTRALAEEFEGRDDELAELALAYYLPTPLTVADDDVVCVVGRLDGRALRAPLL